MLITSKTITLEVNTSISISVTPANICVGDSIDLMTLVDTDSSAALNYYPSLEDATNGTNILGTTFVSPTVDSEYFVKATSPENCATIEKLIVTVNSNPIITTSDSTICEGDSIDLTKFGRSNRCFEFGILQ